MSTSPSLSSLPKNWRHALLGARIVVACIAIGIALLGAFRLFFPISVSVFNFDKPDSLANTFLTPRDEHGASLANGQLDETQTLITTTGLAGNFSAAHFSLTPSRKSLDPTGTTITLRRSFTGFFSPIDTQPAIFPPGTLLTSNGRYAIINTDGKRVEFDSLKTVQQFGYDPQAFLPVSPEEFTLNDKNDFAGDHYPLGTLFVIDGVYYQLEPNNDKPSLTRFVSENAYLSHYDKNQAIPKTENFLKDFTISETWIGFTDGTLLQFADGIFVVDDNRVRPISDPQTFIALGFDWNRVIPASEEELGIYERGKIVQLNSSQPINTIFTDSDTGNAFRVSQQHTLQRITSPTLLSIFTRHTTPITVSSQALKQSISCTLQSQGSLFEKNFVCNTSLETLAALPGNAYELTLHTPRTGVRFNQLETDFATPVRVTTMHETLAALKQQILKRYAQ